MIFDKLYAENLYSFEKLELDFSKYTKGTTIILGRNLDMNSDNAAGKSNILKILYLALWGKDLKNVAVEKCIHRKSKDGAMLIFSFQKDKNNYIIVRFFDYKKNTMFLGKKIKGTGAYFFINNKVMEVDKEKSKINNQILSVIGCTPEVWLNSIFTKQRKEDKDQFLIAPDSKKKDLLSEILDLNYYDKALDKVKADIKANVQLQDKYTTKIDLLSNQKNNLEDQQSKYMEKLIELQDSNIQQEELLNLEVMTLQNEITSLDHSIKVPQIPDLTEDAQFISETKAEIELLQKEISKENGFISLKASLEAKITHNNSIIESNDINIASLNVDLIKLKDTQSNIQKPDIQQQKNTIAEVSKSKTEILEKISFLISQREKTKVIEESLKNLNNQLLDKETLITKLNNELQTIKNEASCFECKRKFTDKETSFYQLLLDQQSAKINNEELLKANIIKEIQLHTIDLNSISAQIEDLPSIEQTANEIQLQLDSLNKELVQMENDEKKLKELTLSINDNTSKIDQILQQSIAIKNEITESSKKLNNIPIMLSKIESCKIKQSSLNQILLEKEATISQYKTIESQYNTSVQLLNEKKNRLNSIIEKKQTLFDNVIPYQEFIVSAKEKLENLTDELNSLNQKKLEVDDLLEYLYFWEKGFSKTGIRSFIIDDVINLLNQYVQHYIDVLSNGTIKLFFSSESTNADDVVSNKISTKYLIDGQETELDLTSGGETQRLILGVDLAISEVVENRSGNKFSLKFLDEPFTNIDSSGQLRALALFRTLSQERNGFFIISHDKELQSACDNAIYVVKKNGVSRIVSEEDFLNAK